MSRFCTSCWPSMLLCLVVCNYHIQTAGGTNRGDSGALSGLGVLLLEVDLVEQKGWASHTVPCALNPSTRPRSCESLVFPLPQSLLQHCGLLRCCTGHLSFLSHCGLSNLPHSSRPTHCSLQKPSLPVLQRKWDQSPPGSTPHFPLLALSRNSSASWLLSCLQGKRPPLIQTNQEPSSLGIQAPLRVLTSSFGICLLAWTASLRSPP